MRIRLATRVLDGMKREAQAVLTSKSAQREASLDRTFAELAAFRQLLQQLRERAERPGVVSPPRATSPPSSPHVATSRVPASRSVGGSRATALSLSSRGPTPHKYRSERQCGTADTTQIPLRKQFAVQATSPGSSAVFSPGSVSRATSPGGSVALSPGAILSRTAAQGSGSFPASPPQLVVVVGNGVRGCDGQSTGPVVSPAAAPRRTPQRIPPVSGGVAIASVRRRSPAESHSIAAPARPASPGAVRPQSPLRQQSPPRRQSPQRQQSPLARAREFLGQYAVEGQAPRAPLSGVGAGGPGRMSPPPHTLGRVSPETRAPGGKAPQKLIEARKACARTSPLRARAA